MNAELPPNLAEFDGFAARQETDVPPWSALRALWNRKYLILAITAICAGAAAIHAVRSRPLYESSARLFVRHGGLIMTGDQGNSATSSLYNQCKVIASTRVLAGAAARLEAQRLKTLAQANPVGVLAGGVGTAIVSGEDMITVNFEGPYPDETPKILDGIIASYVAYHAERKRTIIEDWQNQRTQLRNDLTQLNAVLAKLQQDAGAADQDTVHDELRAATEALGHARLESLASRTAHESAVKLLSAPGGVRALLDSMRASGVQAGPDDPSEAVRAQLAYARQQVADARRRYLPEHPAVAAAEASAASLTSQLEQESRGSAESYVTLLKQRAEQAARREEALRQSIEEQRKRVVEANLRAGALARAEGEIKRTEKTLGDLTQRLEDFKIGKTVAPSVDLVEPPSTPSAPVKPNKMRIIMAGLVGGLLLGSGVGLVRDRLDQRLRSVEDIRITLGMPILGTMPRLKGRGVAGRTADRDPGSEFSEACRAIRTALFFGSPDVQARTILVTSPTPGEGKSTLASNLAISIARAGRRVLLVDADMRRPVQHRVFESAPASDFPRLLAGEGGEGAIEAMCVQSGVPNLDILQCGSIPHNPAELLNSRAFTELLEELSIRYDHVLLDSPPVTAVADAQILAAASSATILVLRADHSTRGATVRAREALAHVGARVLGAVVNDVRERGDRYGRYGYSGKYKQSPEGPKMLPPGKMVG